MTASIVYQEKVLLTAKSYQRKPNDYLDYLCTISIKKSGKNPVQMVLEFDGIFPFAPPMPPERHVIKAPSILELYVKMARWFKKYGYEIK
ncbi:MAG: hypothetical protein ACLFWL_18660 [Candidatus Brocadiia bacterium]